MGRCGSIAGSSRSASQGSSMKWCGGAPRFLALSLLMKMSFALDSAHIGAAVDVDHRAGEIARVLGHEEFDHVADLVGRADAAHGNAAHQHGALRLAALGGQ